MKACIIAVLICAVLGVAVYAFWRLSANKNIKDAEEPSGPSEPAAVLTHVKEELIEMARKTSLPFVQEGDDFVPTLHMVGPNGTKLFNIVHNGLDELRELASNALRAQETETSAYLLAYSVSGEKAGRSSRLLIMEIAERDDEKGLRLAIAVDAGTGSVVGDVFGIGYVPNLLSSH